MSFEDNAKSGKLDAVARKLAGPVGDTRQVSPRLQIAAGLLVTALAVTALWLAVAGSAALGSGLAMAAFAASLMATWLGPQRLKNPDERDKLIIWKSYGTAYAIVLALFVLWAMGNGMVDGEHLWIPQNSAAWKTVSFASIALMGGLGLIAVGWMTPSYAAELDEDI